MNKHWTLLILLLSSNSFATQYMCAGNMEYVGTGDPIETVIATCGQPTQVINQTPQNPSNGGNGSSVSWYYPASVNNNLPAAVGAVVAGTASPSINLTTHQLTVQPNAATPTNLGITFVNGQVSNIEQAHSASELGMGARNAPSMSYNCPGGEIKVGSSMSDVTTACGLPVFQRNLGSAAPQQNNDAGVATTLLVYKPQSYLPAQTFIFQNGLLVAQK